MSLWSEYNYIIGASHTKNIPTFKLNKKKTTVLWKKKKLTKKTKNLFHVHEAINQIILVGSIIGFQHGISVSAPLKTCSKSVSVQKKKLLSQKSLFTFALLHSCS